MCGIQKNGLNFMYIRDDTEESKLEKVEKQKKNNKSIKIFWTHQQTLCVNILRKSGSG